MADNAVNANDFNVNYFDMDEISDVLNEKIERPVHEMVRLGKILCTKDDCIAQRAFFYDNGIAHHFRVKHKEDFSMSDRKESVRISRQLHAQETRECIEQIFEYRRNKVGNIFVDDRNSLYIILI
jgi:hypothetical protein